MATPDSPVPPDIGRVLVLMIDHHLGNFIVSLPVLREFCAYFDGPVDLMVNDGYVELAERAGLDARVVPCPRYSRRPDRVRAFLDQLDETRRLVFGGYKAVFDVGGGVRSTTLVAFTHARHRIGLQTSRRLWLYTRVIDADWREHVFDQYAHLLEAIGRDGRRPALSTMTAPSAARDAVRDRIADAFGTSDAPVLVVHPGAGKSFRRWAPDRFAAAADALVDRFGLRVAIIGTPNDRPIIDEVRGAMQHADAAAPFCLPLLELVALFESAQLLLCNESGPMHLASITGLPIVTIYGPTQESIWGPVRTDGIDALRGAACNPDCRGGACTASYRCLVDMDVQRVVDAAARRLQEPATITVEGGATERRGDEATQGSV